MSEAGLNLVVTDAAKAALAEEGYDPAYGARPLKRVIQQRIANPLASALLETEPKPGQSVEVDHDGDDFTFTPLQVAHAPG